MSKQDFIKKYIDRCDNAISSKNYQEMMALEAEICSVFATDIDYIKNGLDRYGSGAITGKQVDVIGDLQKLKAKLEKLWFELQEVKSIPSAPSIVFNNTNENHNTNNLDISVDIDVLFDTTEKKINEMESLSISQTEEVLSQLNELKQIVKSAESKKSKWDKAGKIFKWLGDKSVEIAIAFIPIINKWLTTL